MKNIITKQKKGALHYMPASSLPASSPRIIRSISLYVPAYGKDYPRALYKALTKDLVRGSDPLYDQLKIIHNCNCRFEANVHNLRVDNRHLAIILFKYSAPIRVIACKEDANFQKALDRAFKYRYRDCLLGDILRNQHVSIEEIDLGEEPLANTASPRQEEYTVFSCNHWSQIYRALRGHHSPLVFVDYLRLNFELKTDTDYFKIDHVNGFLDDDQKRLILAQAHAKFTQL